MAKRFEPQRRGGEQGLKEIGKSPNGKSLGRGFRRRRTVKKTNGAPKGETGEEPLQKGLISNEIEHEPKKRTKIICCEILSRIFMKYWVARGISRK